MKKKIILAVSLLITLYLAQFFYVSLGKSMRYSEALKYLISQGYSKNDIKSLEVRHSFLNVILSYDEWVIRVVFKDEPNAMYFYSYKNNAIQQGGVSGRPEGRFYKHNEGGPIPIN